MIVKIKHLLISLAIITIYSCGPSGAEFNKTDELMMDSINDMGIYADSISLADSLMGTASNEYPEENTNNTEDSIRVMKIKMSNMKLHMLKDSVSSINSKLDSISEYLKK